MGNPTRLTKGDAIVGALTVTEDLTVQGNLTLSGDISLDDITLADDITVDTITVGTGGTTIKAIKYGTISADLPSISTAQTGSVTATITGVASGDMVFIMTPTTSLTGLVLTGINVTSANTVTVYALNASGTSQDASAITIPYIWFDLT